MQSGNTKTYGSLDTTRVSMLQRLSVSAHPTMNEKICLNLIIIQDNMRKLNNNFKTIGTTVDNPNMRKHIRETQKSTRDTVETTKKLINKLNTIVKSSRAEKALKVKSEKLISDFDQIQKKFMHLDKLLNTKIHKTQLTNISEEEYDDEPSQSSTYQQQEQRYLPIDPNFEVELLLEQEQNVMEIEGDVQELSQMMSKLSELVHEQAEPINQIEESVNHTAIDVEESVVELRKAEGYMQKIRKKAILIFVILLILGLIIFAIIKFK